MSRIHFHADLSERLSFTCVDHVYLLISRTECIAEKLLTNWLTFTLSSFMKVVHNNTLRLRYRLF